MKSGLDKALALILVGEQCSYFIITAAKIHILVFC